MDTQQAYEMMRAYLTRPGARRAVEDEVMGGCKYEILFGAETHRCAVGCLLSPQGLAESVYIEDAVPMELRYFSGGLDDARNAGYKLPELDDVDERFLTAAQISHDMAENWDQNGFKVEVLDKAAGQHGLVVVDDRTSRQEVVVA